MPLIAQKRTVFFIQFQKQIQIMLNLFGLGMATTHYIIKILGGLAS